METIYSDDNVKLLFHPAKGSEACYVEVTWNGQVEHARYVKVYEMALDKAAQHKDQRPRMLINQSKLENIEPRSRAWLLSNYAPRLRRHFEGTLYLSVVLPEKKFAEVMMNSIMFFLNKVVKNLVIQTFREPEEAHKWVRTTAPTPQ